MKPVRTRILREMNKKIIYHWSGKGGAAPLAAALHLGWITLQTERHCLKNIPFAGGVSPQETGILIFLGKGEKGEEVCLLALGKKGELLLTVVRETARLLGEDPKIYYFVDCEKYRQGRKKEAFLKNLNHMVIEVKKETAQEL